MSAAYAHFLTSLGLKSSSASFKARLVMCLSSRQTNYLPLALLDKPLDDVMPNDTERPNNDRLILHILPHS